MLFNSADFVVFALVFFLLWPALKDRSQRRWIGMTIASLIFYGWWDWRYIFLIILSGLIDFNAALWMRKAPGMKKALLLTSLCANLGILAGFKYLNFFLENVGLISDTVFGMSLGIPVLDIVLPVGISFFTFQSMSYTIDVYKDELEPTHNIWHFFAYLAMFPQLVAGPIVRASDLLPQLERSRKVTPQMRWDGLQLITHGMFKKVVIADNLAPGVNSAFGGPHIDEPLYWWFNTARFAVQIYCDFSGYSNIARGLALWMGYEFPVNFNHPYASTSFREFWTRWHISLSSWFRDYVYIPLGGSRVGRVRSHVNMWVTMVLSGIWHGASWNFVIWGALHALFTSVERETSWYKYVLKLGTPGRLIAGGVVLFCVLLSWVPFRAETLTQTIMIYATMFDVTKLTEISATKASALSSKSALLIFMLLVGRELTYLLKLDRFVNPRSKPYLLIKPLVLAGMIVASIYLRGSGEEFIYFQF